MCYNRAPEGTTQKRGHSDKRSSGASRTFFHPARLRLERRSPSSSYFNGTRQPASTHEIEQKGTGAKVSTTQINFCSSVPAWCSPDSVNNGGFPAPRSVRRRKFTSPWQRPGIQEHVGIRLTWFEFLRLCQTRRGRRLVNIPNLYNGRSNVNKL